MGKHSTRFYGSQAGESSLINYSYTDMPFKLLGYDIYYFFRFSWAIPYIILPANPPYLSGDMDELSPTPKNLFCIVVHFVLCVLQLGFVVALLPICVLLPVWVAGLVIAAFMLLNALLCKTLNGKEETLTSNPQYAPALEKHAHEQWIFLNGVAVGQHWLQNNIDRLALTFKRPIIGIHNKTDGIIFDVVECLIQRTFGYATSDVRLCYALVKEKLYDPQYSKLVLILHSQGGIEGGLVLDWLLQEIPQDLLAKLEVYTFGNAANHFNNPYRHVTSQETESKPLETIAESTQLHAPEQLTNGTQTQHTSSHPRRTPAPRIDTTVRMLARETSAPHPSAITDRAIGHVEHYAHTTDFVALWGVLHFATSAPATPVIPRFVGRLFARRSDRGGHQFCQHYLDGMFPLRRDPAAPGGFSGCIEAGSADEGLNEFMDSEVAVGRAGDESADAQAAFEASWIGGLVDEIEDVPPAAAAAAGEVKLHNASPTVSRKGSMRVLKVKQLSRLWQYRNGLSPEETPVSLRVDPDGIVRGKTL